VLTEVLGLHPEKHSDVVLKRLGVAMRKLGWEGPKPLRVNEPVRSDPHNPLPARKGRFQGYWRSVHHEPVQLEMEDGQ
jgi:hypothetical protein